MSDFFSIGSSGFFDSYFGTSSSSNNSSSSSLLGDYSMIKSGAYTKLLKKYYAENPVQREEGKTSIKDSKASDTNTSLLAVKNSSKQATDSAKKLSESVGKLTDEEMGEAKKKDLLKDAKSFVENYNSMIKDLDNIESVSILQNAVWMTSQTSKSANVLSAVGISIGSDNKLSIDEEKFMKANDSAFKSAFAGANSPLAAITQRSSQIYNMSGTQAILNAKNTSYTSSGGYNTLMSQSLINSLM